ncbi:MAG: 2-dehydro-3-deoxygalactonokinase [Pseudomonadota bacterium]
MDGGQVFADWIAVDWGTSNLRAWAMTHDGSDLAHMTSNRGMAGLGPSEFEGVLLDVLQPWLGRQALPVVACGMVGSRQGWVEAPYNTVPCAPQTSCIQADVRSAPLTVHVIGGVKQDRPADVMRGEETQIAGFLSLNPGWDGVICLPGTHTKWVHVSAGEIVSFQTFMTGELFALLSDQSVLKHSICGDWDEDAFATALDDAMSRPAATAARLFNIRAEGLVHGTPGGWADARLSGLLIGAELAAARPYWLGQSVAMIGAQPLAGHYASALETQGVPVTLTDATQMTLAGLKAAYATVVKVPTP